MPLTARCNGCEFPINIPVTAANAPKGTQLHTLVPGQHNDVPMPHYPGTPEFDEQLEEVIDVRRQVELNHWPKEFLAKNNPSQSDGSLPDILVGTGIFQNKPLTAANYVAMDDPEDLGKHLFKKLRSWGVPFKQRYDHFPFHEEITGSTERLIKRIRRAHHAGWQVKNYYGLERPEMVLGLPGPVFCSGGGQAPNHFSYVANHATGYGATFIELLDTFDFSQHTAEMMMVLDALWQGAQYRTLHGVHYRQDNEQGFLLGARITDDGDQTWMEYVV